MHEINRVAPRHTLKLSLTQCTATVYTVFFQRLSALSYRDWYIEDGYEGTIKPIRSAYSRFQYPEKYHYTLSLSLSVSIYILRYCNNRYAISIHPSIHPHFLVNHFQPLRGRSLFPLENGGFSFLFETDSEHFSFSSARLTRLIRTLEFLGIFATTVVMAVFPVQALSFPLLKSDSTLVIQRRASI